MPAIMNKQAQPPSGTDARMHWPCLITALVIMFGITLYPPLLANATGKADHGLAILLMLSMSAGFVRGVGFIPRSGALQLLFSSWACFSMLALSIFLLFR